MSTAALFTVVLPVFALIGIGYAIVALRIVGEEVGEALASFVFTIAVPLLLFRALGTLELPDVSPVPLWLAYFAGVFLNIAVGILVTERVFGRDARAGVIGGMSASYANLVMVGLPVVTQAFGEEGLVLALILVAIHLPIMMAVSAFFIEFAEHRTGSSEGRMRIGAALARTFRSLLANPFIIAMGAGLAFRATGLPLSGVPREVIDRISDTAIPLALVALGMSLNRYGLRGNVVPALVLGAAKLVLMPAVVFVVAAYAIGLPPLWVAVATVGAACPTGVNAYLMANRFQTGHALSANTITLTTALSLVTFTLWLSLFKG